MRDTEPEAHVEALREVVTLTLGEGEVLLDLQPLLEREGEWLLDALLDDEAQVLGEGDVLVVLLLALENEGLRLATVDLDALGVVETDLVRMLERDGEPVMLTLVD